MIINILQLVLVLALFFPIKFICWKITEEWGLPMWLDYKPWNCRLCLTFWSLLACYISVGLLFSLWILMAVGGLLTVLNAIAMWIDQRKKTVKFDIDIDNDNKIIEIKPKK